MAEILVEDGGTITLRGFGQRRVKMLIELVRHDELDEEGWTGRVEFHAGPSSVKAAVLAAPHEIQPWSGV